MIHIKKTILTLALLIAATTQAWAGEIFTTLKVGDVIHVGDQFTISEDWGCINYFFDSYLSPFTLIRANAPDFDPNAAETYVTPDEDGAYYVIQCNYNGETLYGFTYYDRFPATANSDGLVVTNIDTSGMHKVYTFAVHEAYPVPVAWNADTKTGTIAKMPAGNVEVSPEYFPQATAGNGAVTAATSAQAQTDSPLVTVDNAKLTGASALKFCVTSTNTAPGYDDTGWTTTVPTAKDFNAAGGTAYVWYYPVGNDDTDPTKIYSDGDMCATALEVTVAAAPTYDVVINTAGLSAEEAGKWSASPNTGVKKGDEVTVTYTGTRKVIGVKAQKTGPLYMKWDDSQKALVPTEIPATVTKVEDAEHVTWPAGTYLVEGDVGINGYIELTGDVELIIKDGAKLTAKEIYGEDIYSLSVYGQTNMSGELNLACSFDDAINCMTALNIHSCKVNASSSEDNNGGFFNILEVNVYGGLVNAEYTGSSNGFGIGSDVMNIYGGEVKAIGKGNDNDYSYGINNSNGTTVNVYGGKLWAECSGNRAINSNVTLTKGEGFNGKIETCSDGTSWAVYTETGTPDAPYVRVGY